ncbi:MAG: putative 2,4-dienoyl-CoA reductase [Planctomycetes bacterium]|nr:putative 2,4-dienoyl-CoA reductase [Planctomycetota bacterium]
MTEHGGDANPKTDRPFAGKTAVVTGGGTGLGLAVSTRLGALGANVVCASRDLAHHSELIDRGVRLGFAVMSVPMDVSDPKSVRSGFAAAAERFGAVDVLVNNAAGNFIRPSMALAPKGFARVIDIALNGVFYCSREAGLLMRERGGAIVNISAPYASTGKPGVVHSACAKAGVEAMTRTLAAEWAPNRIRVNAVSPGPFVSQGAADRLWPSEDMVREVRSQIPLGRFGTAEEVADLVVWLAGPQASWITGAVWVADGGWSLAAPFLGAEAVKVLRRRDDA